MAENLNDKIRQENPEMVNMSMRTRVDLDNYYLPSAERGTSWVIWISRLVRWGLGMLFIVASLAYFGIDALPLALFGVVIFITGFLNPKRCIDNSCELPSNKTGR